MNSCQLCDKKNKQQEQPEKAQLESSPPECGNTWHAEAGNKNKKNTRKNILS